MAGDWIKLHRQAIDSDVFSDPVLWRLFTWCLMKANFRDGFFRGTEIKRGQFVTGKLTGSEALQMSPTSFHRGLERLERLGCITKKADSKWTTITVCNYDTYQDEDEKSGPQVDHARTARGPYVEPIEEEQEEQEEQECIQTHCDEPRIVSSLVSGNDRGCLFFPCSGGVRRKGRAFNHASPVWALTLSKVNEWRQAFPGLDIAAQCRKARQWCIDNKAKRKTPGGMLRFLNSWMERNQNDAAKSGTGSPRGNYRQGNSGVAARQDALDEQMRIIADFAAGDDEIEPAAVRRLDGSVVSPEAYRRLE